MATRKTKTRTTKKLSKVTPRMDAPNQLGTVELHAPGIFGTRLARIRSESEAAQAVKVRSSELQKLCGIVMRDLPPTGTATLGLIRNREIQQRLVQHAQAAAEAIFPGFNELMKALAERENEFVQALGQIGQGVA